jgi:hypothetical protein
MLVANVKGVVRVLMVSARVIKICHSPGHVQAKCGRRRETSGFDLFPDVGERVNSVRVLRLYLGWVLMKGQGEPLPRCESELP